MMNPYDGNLGYSKEFRVEGIKETLDVFQQLADEIGDKKATSRFLIPAMKKAMAPVLTAARLLVPRDTGLLARNLMVSAKRPSSKDRRSKYVSQTDTVIAKVSTTPIAAKHKKERRDLAKSLGSKNIRVDNKKFYESKGYFYDGRAIANEFGTSKRAAKPFLRPAMEGQAATVIDVLSVVLNQKILQFRSKTVK